MDIEFNDYKLIKERKKSSGSHISIAVQAAKEFAANKSSWEDALVIDGYLNKLLEQAGIFSYIAPEDIENRNHKLTEARDAFYAELKRDN